MTFEEFDALMYGWHNDTQFHSSHFNIAKHQNYEKIIAYAAESTENKNEIIGYTCLLLVNTYIHNCFIILGRLVVNPPPYDPYYAGRVPVARECWRYWALKENIVKGNHDVHEYWVEDNKGNKGKWH